MADDKAPVDKAPVDKAATAIDKADVTRRIKKLISELAGGRKPWNQYHRADRLRQDLGFDDRSLVQLAEKLVAELADLGLGKRLQPDHLQPATTLGGLSDIVWSKNLEVLRS